MPRQLGRLTLAELSSWRAGAFLSVGESGKPPADRGNLKKEVSRGLCCGSVRGAMPRQLGRLLYPWVNLKKEASRGPRCYGIESLVSERL